MTIREELREKYQREVAREEQEQQDRDKRIEEKAIKFIENSLIPEFRKMSEIRPLTSHLYIYFIVTVEGIVCNTTLSNPATIADGKYDLKVIKRAVEIASKYDITAGEVKGNNIETYEFSLDLI